MTLDTGLPGVFLASPNADERREAVDLLVLHYTGMPSAEAASSWLRDPRSKVSAHYFVHEDGRLEQHVRETDRAWHAGVSCWRGREGLNHSSIGVEIANAGHPGGCPPFPARQLDTVARLCRDIMQRHGLTAADVVAHSDIAPERKEDPGEVFPWAVLGEAGLTVWCPQAEPDGETDPATFNDALKAFGYCVGDSAVFDERSRACLRAFQRRFLPDRIDGVPDAQAFATLRRAREAASAARGA